MIIVHQNKTSIFNFDKVSKIEIAFINGEYQLRLGQSEKEWPCWIASYGTKERAKKVLQEIIDEYMDCNGCETNNLRLWIRICKKYGL